MSGSSNVVEFYRRLFGWQPTKGLFLLGGQTVAAYGTPGGGGGDGSGADDGADSYWRISFRTDLGPLAVAGTVESAGGSTESANHDFGHFRDPGGHRFGVRRGGYVPALDAVDVPGALWWTQLYVSDAAEAAAAKRFHLAVFGWDMRDIVLERGADYTVLSPAGAGIEGAHGGIIRLPPADPAGAPPVPGWVPYFRVADCDATVAEALALGAAVVHPPESAAGIGRQATLRDPGRGQFAINQVT
ncbi:VOC family protein [Streptomyces sp. NPDC050504]|uniref:VOC family protein n=1 Tax=Streptomyces sp. NPDC050504 TaxID=3365618 RepID=UPI00378EAD03